MLGFISLNKTVFINIKCSPPPEGPFSLSTKFANILCKKILDIFFPKESKSCFLKKKRNRINYSFSAPPTYVKKRVFLFLNQFEKYLLPVFALQQREFKILIPCTLRNRKILVK